MTWDGAILGTGTQIITESRPFEHVATTVNPGESGESRTWFGLAGQDGQTTITWHFETDYGYNVAARFAGLAFAGVVRREFEKGLAGLKDLAETLPATGPGAPASQPASLFYGLRPHLSCMVED